MLGQAGWIVAGLPLEKEAGGTLPRHAPHALQGCAACPAGSVLTADVEARASPRGSVVYAALPTRCRRCGAEELGCAGCEDWAGCTSCPAGHVRVPALNAANYSRCVGCAALGCAACEDGVGCTACPEGSFLFSGSAGG